MSPEEGELDDTAALRSESDLCTSEDHSHDPSYEWPEEHPAFSFPDPGTSSLSQPRATKSRPHQPSFRLIVLHSSILSSTQKLAIIDGYSEVQFGRDIAPAGSMTPKIRLKEMEVSKLHATAYWDRSRQEWGVVDMGSVHGTFVRPVSTAGDDRGVRLSPSRQASIPRTLKHMDRLTIGGTTFLVHMHKDQLPCEECSLIGKEEIPLFPVSKTAKVARCDQISTEATCSSIPSKDPKKALNLLKHSLLARHQSSSPRPSPHADSAAQYVDRSARRRALMPAAHPDARISSPTLLNEPSRPKTPATDPISELPMPLPPSNVGHRLLMKQGWEPGTALGSELDKDGDRIGLVQPLEVSTRLPRGGLGLKRNANWTGDVDWKESAKRKRWDSTG